MAATTDILLPADQSEGSTHEVGRWLVRVGDAVRTDEPLLEVITDKVTVEIAAPADGVLAEILRQPGERIERGEVLGRIRVGAPVSAAARTVPSEESAPSDHPTARPPDLGELSPAVRRLIKEHGLDPAKIPGTGKGSRITAQDVESYLAGISSGPAVQPSSRPDSSRLVPHSAMRRTIAEHLVHSVQTAPHVTAVFEADLTRVMAHRDASKPGFQAGGVSLTFTAYFVRASVAALRAVPEVNSRWHAEGLELFADCNIGVAVALAGGGGGGLIVPVLHRAQELDLLETARRLEDLTRRAREGKLHPSDVQGGTFTISNHGVSGSLFAAPIVIVQPQSAILGVGKIESRARVMSSGAIEARPMAYVSLTIDHRVLDGSQGNAFLSAWVATIENWGENAP